MSAINLKCLFLNAENLFLFFDQELPEKFLSYSEPEWKNLSTSAYTNKPLRKTVELTKIITNLDPDLVLLAEVGGEESLANWNKYFLNSNYYVALIEGNSDRSIDVGFLIHKRCPFHFSIETNKNRILKFNYPHELKATNPQLPTHKFSRDVAELHLFATNKDKPFFIFLLSHLKSPLDPEGIDSNGTLRREAELHALLEIYKKHEATQVPIAIVGDLNGNASRHGTENEFKAIYKTTQLEDIFELSKKPLSERNTYDVIRNSGKVESRQIDFCFLSPSASRLLKTDSTEVYRYKNELGQFFIPKTLFEKELLPSDHYPIVFEFQNIKKDFSA
jgi:hypothetical protein